MFQPGPRKPFVATKAAPRDCTGTISVSAWRPFSRRPTNMTDSIAFRSSRGRRTRNLSGSSRTARAERSPPFCHRTIDRRGERLPVPALFYSFLLFIVMETIEKTLATNPYLDLCLSCQEDVGETFLAYSPRSRPFLLEGIVASDSDKHMRFQRLPRPGECGHRGWPCRPAGPDNPLVNDIQTRPFSRGDVIDDRAAPAKVVSLLIGARHRLKTARWL